MRKVNPKPNFAGKRAKPVKQTKSVGGKKRKMSFADIQQIQAFYNR